MGGSSPSSRFIDGIICQEYYYLFFSGKYWFNIHIFVYMKTEQIMVRDLNGIKVSQRISDSFFNATELLNEFNRSTGKNKVMPEFWSNKSTDSFLESLSKELSYNIGDSLVLEKDLFTTKRGKHGGTYMHPYLFIKFAMWLSSDFEVQVIKWVYDNLIDFRHEAGDYYLEMCSAISDRYFEYYGKRPSPLIFIKEANYLNKLVYGEYKGNNRNLSTQEQLDRLNKLQKANIKLIKEGLGVFDRKEKLREFYGLL